MPWGTQQLQSTPDFVADWESISRSPGRQIDWANVTTLINGKKVVKAGTVMVEIAGGKMAPRASRPGAETAIGVIFSTAIEGLPTHSLSGYGLITGGVVYGNLLPEGVPVAGVITELNAAGTGFQFVTYQDSSEV